MHVKNFLGLAALALSLVACGGGGGGGVGASGDTAAPPPTPQEAAAPTFDLKAAWASYMTTPATRNFSITGMASGEHVTGSGSDTVGALAAASFEGHDALQRVGVTTGTIEVKGETVPYSASITNYVDSQYRPLGYQSEEYAVISGEVTIPGAAHVNDTGTLYAFKRYTDSSKSVLLGTLSYAYALQPDTSPQTALLKIIATGRDADGTITYTDTLTFRMTPSGGLTWLTDEYLGDSSALVMRY